MLRASSHRRDTSGKHEVQFPALRFSWYLLPAPCLLSRYRFTRETTALVMSSSPSNDLSVLFPSRPFALEHVKPVPSPEEVETVGKILREGEKG